jgi:hypothetical protein
MSRRAFPIFYEDARSDIKQFGLHELVVACVSDLWGSVFWDSRGRFHAIPMKGDSNLLAACERDVPNMPHRLIFAVFDADKLHRLLYQSGRPSNDELLAELRRRCPDPRLHLFLLEDNTETVVNAAAACLGEAPPAKNLLLRDSILNRAANAPPQVRERVRKAVPSFNSCVERIAELSRSS